MFASVRVPVALALVACSLSAALADDEFATERKALTQEIAALAVHPGAVRLLWEVCQIPDYRKVLSDSHTRLLGECFIHLSRREQRLPEERLRLSVARLNLAHSTIQGEIRTV